MLKRLSNTILRAEHGPLVFFPELMDEEIAAFDRFSYQLVLPEGVQDPDNRYDLDLALIVSGAIGDPVLRVTK